MKIDATVQKLYGCALAALILTSSISCMEPQDQELELKPLLCLIEERGHMPFDYDMEQAVRDSSERIHDSYNFSINRTDISTEELFDFINKGCNLLDPHCAAVITIAGSPVVLAIDEWTKELSIPHLILSLDPAPCRVTSSNSLHLAPAGPIKGNVIDILIQKVLQWKELVFIYDDYLDMVQLAHLQSVLSQAVVSSGMFKLPSDLNDQFVEELINATRLTKHVFLAVHSQSLDAVMETAFTNNLFAKQYSWIVTSNTSCLEALNRSILRKSKVLFLRQTPFIIPKGQSYSIQVVTDYSYIQERADLLSAGIEALLRGLEEARLGSFIHTSKSICDRRLTDLRKKAISAARRKEVLTDSGLVAFDKDGKVSTYGYEFCSSDDTATDGHVGVGWWSPYNGLTSQDSVFNNAFKNFGGRKLLIGTVEAAPFVMKRQSETKLTYEGFCIDILQELASRLNFTYEIIEDKRFGSPDLNGSWSGVVGMVMRGEVAFGIGALSISTEREKVIDFSIPFAEDGVGILTKKNKLDSSAMFRLFTPLQPVVWGFLAMLVICVSFILYIINRKSPFQSEERLSFFSCFWAILGPILNQGSEFQPKSGSGKLVLGSWWVFTIVFVSTYTANMAAVLTVTIYDKPINSLAELAGQSEVRPVVRSGSHVNSLFKEATNNVYKRIWNLMETMPNITSGDEALALVRTQNFAYMSDRSQLEYIQQNNCESYMLADEIFNTGGMGIIVPKNAAFLNAMDLIIMKLQESGIIDGWRRQWWKGQTSVCNSNDRESTADQLDLNYLAGCFFVFLGATALSIILVFIERLFVTEGWKRLRRQTFLSNIG
ncbi:hypothetical protein BsWGS_05778 [Bradybaena similaris]